MFRGIARRTGSSVAIETDGERYLRTRLALLKEKMDQVDQLASDGELPDAEITGELLKVSPLKKSVHALLIRRACNRLHPGFDQQNFPSPQRLPKTHNPLPSTIVHSHTDPA